ncbi:SAM-dependent methyltransferase [Bacillus sp. FJAT-42376]|uniref:class I SAM-dependent methyltransferase n=1 Tax=Bacillus sp. FJAT-42376 TaxID=2014076 RepID=UPI000F4E7E5D|nr:class I SAM-dependent methyltransferase [Bacillus sp. FJAT-42376]AZB43197.1 SAM-dependent methyltransferase [Bacillus sp. FJAT-42376]
MPDYLNMIASLGIAGAHPGGLQLTKQILSEMDLSYPSRILDAGCGTGQTLSYLSRLGYETAGVDADPRMVKKAMNRLSGESIPVKEGKLELLPFQSNEFNAIFCESILSFTRLTDSLNECMRVLKAGGTVAAIEVTLEKPADPEVYREITDFYGFQNLQDEEAWINEFKTAGFSKVRSLRAEDFSFVYDENEPDHEVFMDETVAPDVFQTLSKHQEMLQKFGQVLGYRVFLAKK